jgi:two-component system, NarL family, sensor histidine kinase UhpB
LPGKNLKVLMVEDSVNDADLILRELSKQGYQPVFERVEDAGAMQDALEKQPWDLIIADYVLPNFSGLGALKILHEKRLDIPCIITSGRIDDETAVAAMRAGAKDYIMKDNLKRLGPAVTRELSEVQVRRERRSAEEALQQNEAKLGLLLQQMPCILWTADANLIVTSLLGAGLRNIDLKADQAPGKKVAEVFPAVNSDTIEAHLQALGGIPASFELDMAHRILYCFVEPLQDISGIIIGVIGVALDVTDMRHAEDELRALSHKLVDAQETERRTIARELHDQIGQSLTVLKLLLGQAERSTAAGVGGILNESQTLVSELIQQVREMSLRLRPSMLDDLGLLPTLVWHFERFTRLTGIQIKFEHDGLQVQLPPQVNTAVYRIVQEALTNIARYARTGVAEVQIRVDNGQLSLAVDDHGCGFDPAKLAVNTSTGISGMRERAYLLGGWLTIETTPGEGTHLRAEIPLSAKNQYPGSI